MELPQIESFSPCIQKTAARKHTRQRTPSQIIKYISFRTHHTCLRQSEIVFPILLPTNIPEICGMKHHQLARHQKTVRRPLHWCVSPMPQLGTRTCPPDFLLNYESQSSSSSNERNCGCSFGTSLWRKHQSNSEVHPNDKSMVWHDEREESERSCSEKEPWCSPICQCWRPSSELVEHRFSAISEWLEDGRGCQLTSSPKKWASSQTAQSSTKSIVECTRFLLNHGADFVLSISIRTHWNDT